MSYLVVFERTTFGLPFDHFGHVETGKGGRRRACRLLVPSGQVRGRRLRIRGGLRSFGLSNVSVHDFQDEGSAVSFFDVFVNNDTPVLEAFPTSLCCSLGVSFRCKSFTRLLRGTCASFARRINSARKMANFSVSFIRRNSNFQLVPGELGLHRYFRDSRGCTTIVEGGVFITVVVQSEDNLIIGSAGQSTSNVCLAEFRGRTVIRASSQLRFHRSAPASELHISACAIRED